MPSVAYRHPTQWSIKLVMVILLARWLTGPVMIARAAEPQSDPAGIATGDKSAVSDAAGNPLVIPTEPTDKTAPDYKQKKKDFDEFQAQRPKSRWREACRQRGHIRIATNFAWTLLLDIWCSSCKPGLRCSPAGWCERRTPGI